MSSSLSQSLSDLATVFGRCFRQVSPLSPQRDIETFEVLGRPAIDPLIFLRFRGPPFRFVPLALECPVVKIPPRHPVSEFCVGAKAPEANLHQPE